MEKPVISILIANYNNGKYFRDCWQSLISQTFANWEVIIVDDGSIDNSLEVIRNLTGTDPRVKIYINDINYGCGYTKKKCIDLASANLCAFLDPDDALEPNALEVMIKIFNTNSDVALAYSKYTRCDENLNSLNDNIVLKKINSKDPYFFNFNGAISHFVTFSKTAYQRTVGIDPYMLRAVDQDLYFKLCEQGEVIAIDLFLYKYRIHENGISTGVDDSNVSKAEYWHWYAINAAAKRRNIIVEKVFLEKYVNRSSYAYLKKSHDLILKSGSYKLARIISAFLNVILNRK